MIIESNSFTLSRDQSKAIQITFRQHAIRNHEIGDYLTALSPDSFRSRDFAERLIGNVRFAFEGSPSLGIGRVDPELREFVKLLFRKWPLVLIVADLDDTTPRQMLRCLGDREEGISSLVRSHVQAELLFLQVLAIRSGLPSRLAQSRALRIWSYCGQPSSDFRDTVWRW